MDIHKNVKVIDNNRKVQIVNVIISFYYLIFLDKNMHQIYTIVKIIKVVTIKIKK